jgi:hypothetical protein
MKMRDSLAIGAATILCFGSTPAFAQIVNNSNMGGVNNSNSTGVNTNNPPITNFGTSGGTGSAGYNASVLDQARSLQQRLADSQTGQSCTGVRSFLRTQQACPTNAELNKAKADAVAFLDSVKNPNASLLAPSSAPAAKFNPTW